METKVHLYCSECGKMLNISDAKKTITPRPIATVGKSPQVQEFFIKVDICSCAGGKSKKAESLILKEIPL